MTLPIKYDDVRLIHADPRTHVRSTLKIALAHAGIEGIEHTGSIKSVSEALDQSVGPDILICDMGIGDGQACEFISAIRHNEVGRNPFLCIIGVTWTSTVSDVTKVIDSGVDHLVSAPLSPQQILVRIRALAKKRAPFVVTSDYVGPDRRRLEREASKIPLFDVPNSLQEKVAGTWDPGRFDRSIKNALGNLSTFRIDRQAEDIMVLASLIADQSALRGTATMAANFDRLAKMVNDMERGASGQGFFHISELCRACVGIVDEIKASGGFDVKKDLELLKQLGRAIRTALYPEDNSDTLARDIARTVSGSR
jgi:DNA-binding response OmpR family regulator